ncbi:MAG: LamG domain-containing protein, partial [Candidatus Kuenenia sp.]|nr:LamG domain-containing protein [Candidatus Kuenenia hertensis]
TITETDVAGNTGSESITVILDNEASIDDNPDTTAPVVAIVSPENGAVVSSTPIDVTYTVDGGAQKTVSRDLIEGENTITISETDDAGNEGTASITVTLDTGGMSFGGKAASYTFDEGSGAVAVDTSGNGNDGVITGAVFSTGKSGSGLAFDGTDDYVSIPCMNYDEISISAWFYKNENDATNADAIFGGWKWNSDEQMNEGFDIRFHKNSPDTIDFCLVTEDTGGTRTIKAVSSNLGNSTGTWYHVVGTYNQSTGEQKLYINGVLAVTENHPAGNTIVPLSSYSDMRIGHSRVNNGYFNGIIDEVSVYDYPLSDQEVLDVYNSSIDAKAAYYTFDEGSGAVAVDTSGNGNDGVITGAVFSTGKSGSGLAFDGTDDYVSIPCMNYDEISISAWFYKNENDATNADAIFGGWKWNSDEQMNEGFDIRFHKNSPDTIDFCLVTEDTGGTRTIKAVSSNLGNSTGTWYHVVGTYNQSTGEQKLYINGVLAVTENHPAGNTIVPLSSYSDMRIGHSRVNNGYFNGIIDEVSVYDYPLSDQEVLNLYNGY